MTTTPVRVLYSLAGAPAQDGAEDRPARCAVCAVNWTRTAGFDGWQGANFTDQNKVRAWGTGRICEPCIWAHSWAQPPGFPAKAEGKKGVNLRLYSHLWSEAGGYEYANKADKPRILDWLREPKRGPWFAAVADSGQKHTLPWARINFPGPRQVIRFEERDVILGDWALADSMRELLTDGVTKDEIETGDYRVMSWGQSGSAIESFERAYGALRLGSWWTLVLWLSQRDEQEYERRANGRREARTAAKPQRGSTDVGEVRVPRSRRKPAQALGPDPGPAPRSSQDVGERGAMGDVPLPIPRPLGPGQGSLFGD